MDFLNQAAAQVTNLFRSMTVGARIVAALLLTLIVVSLAYLFNHQFAGPDAYLMGGEMIAPEEMNAIVGALGNAGLKNFQVEGGKIRVPRGEEAAYMAALVDEGVVPGGYGSYLQKSLNDGGLFISKAQQAQRTKVAIQMELQRVIRQMKGIKNAFVLYEIQEDRRLNSKKEFSANVSVGTIAGSSLDDGKVNSIRHLVASAIGMPPEKVAVTDLDGGFTYPATKPGQNSFGLQDGYIQNKINYERIISENIRAALNYVPGVVVACTVELKDQIEHEQHKTQHDPKTINTFVTEESKTLNSQGPQVSGPPGLGSQGGVPPNQPAVARAGNSGAAKTDEETSRSTVRSVTSVDQERIKLAPLTPSRVTAAIAVPSSYIEQVWLERNPSAPGDPPKKPTVADLKPIEEEKIRLIQEHVAQLIPLPNVAAPNPIPLVKVTVFDKLPGDPIAEPGVTDHVLGWMGDHWSTLGTGILGLVSLVMLRSMVRSAPPSEPLTAATAAAVAEETPESTPTSEAKATVASRLKRREKGGPSLREELVEIVREDPDAAANVLRSWINSSI